VRIIPSISVALLIKYRKTAAESLDTKYHLEPATCHKLDIDSGRTKDSGARLTYELRNNVTTLSNTHELKNNCVINRIQSPNSFSLVFSLVYFISDSYSLLRITFFISIYNPIYYE
jgi:hypothetical protein